MMKWFSAGSENEDLNSLKLSFSMFFWVFLLFSVLGTVIEGTYWIIRYGHFAMRSGLIYGPFSEVYGCAAVLMVLLLFRFREKSPFFLFITGFVTGVLFELFASFAEQSVFGFTSWDYGNAKYAIAGRANLIFGIVWGLFAIMLIKKWFPALIRLIGNLPQRAVKSITIVLAAFILFDCAISAAAVYRYNERLKNIPPANSIERTIDNLYPDAYLKKIYSRINKR